MSAQREILGGMSGFDEEFDRERIKKIKNSFPLYEKLFNHLPQFVGATVVTSLIFLFESNLSVAIQLSGISLISLCVYPWLLKSLVLEKIAADNFPYAYKNWLILVREREEIKEQLMED